MLGPQGGEVAHRDSRCGLHQLLGEDLAAVRGAPGGGPPGVAEPTGGLQHHGAAATAPLLGVRGDRALLLRLLGLLDEVGELLAQVRFGGRPGAPRPAEDCHGDHVPPRPGGYAVTVADSVTSTPCQNATRPRTCSASGFGSA